MRYPAHVAVGDHPDVLRRILEPDINLAIWRRRLNSRLKESVAAVVSANPDKRLPALEKFPAATALSEFSRNLPPYLCYKDAQPLRDDIKMCTLMFRRIVRPEYITMSLRLENPGPLWDEDWHPDALRYRFICIYSGELTLWLANGDAHPSGPLRYERKRGAPIRRFPLGAVCLFKGVHLTHVVPPLIHSGPSGRVRRLLMVVND